MTLRAFNIKQDVDVMVPLIKSAFDYPEHEEWNLSAEEITGIADDFTTMSKLYPIFQIGGRFNASLKDVMQGYIWEEQGQAVGLVNISPIGPNNPTWIIGNVAVLPEHRRKGIAQQLIQAAIDLARQRQIKNVVLEVIADNVPAVKLYQNKGFEIYSTGVQLHREVAREVPPLPELPAGYTIAEYRVGDWESRYELMKNITPPAVQQYEPIDRKKFYKSPPMRLLRAIIIRVAPSKTTSYLVRHQATNAVVARFACYQRKKAGGINEIQIDLDPNHASLAPYLVNRCIHDAAGRDTELNIDKWQPAVLQAALDAGFVKRAEWNMMGMHLTQP